MEKINQSVWVYVHQEDRIENGIEVLRFQNPRVCSAIRRLYPCRACPSHLANKLLATSSSIGALTVQLLLTTYLKF